MRLKLIRLFIICCIVKGYSNILVGACFTPAEAREYWERAQQYVKTRKIEWDRLQALSEDASRRACDKHRADGPAFVYSNVQCICFVCLKAVNLSDRADNARVAYKNAIDWEAKTRLDYVKVNGSSIEDDADEDASSNELKDLILCLKDLAMQEKRALLEESAASVIRFEGEGDDLENEIRRSQCLARKYRALSVEGGVSTGEDSEREEEKD